VVDLDVLRTVRAAEAPGLRSIKLSTIAGLVCAFVHTRSDRRVDSARSLEVNPTQPGRSRRWSASEVGT